VLRPLADRVSAIHFTKFTAPPKSGALQNLQVAAPFLLTYNLGAVSFPEREKK